MRAFGVMDGDANLTPLPYYKTPAQGASTSVLLAASPLVDGVTGRYFEDNQEARAVQGDEVPSGGFATHALDPESADRLCSGSTPPRPSGSNCPRMLRPKRASGAAFATSTDPPPAVVERSPHARPVPRQSGCRTKSYSACR